MIVTYLRKNEQVVSIIKGFPQVWEENNQLLIEGGMCPLLNDLTQAGWGYYEDKIIERRYDEEDNEIPVYMADLNLTPVLSSPPRSTHVSVLTAVNPSNVRPATIKRTWNGQDYFFDCFVTQTVADEYVSGKIKLGDYVLVHFDDIGEQCVTAKVFKSW